MSLYKLGFLDHFPDEEERRYNYLHGIVRPEGRHRPRFVCRISVDNCHNDHPNECKVCTVWLKPCKIGEGSAVQALCFASAMEEDVGQTYDDIIDKPCVIVLIIVESC